eukprot:2573467-Rhodomonas_salina.2
MRLWRTSSKCKQLSSSLAKARQSLGVAWISGCYAGASNHGKGLDLDECMGMIWGSEDDALQLIVAESAGGGLGSRRAMPSDCEEKLRQQLGNRL